MFKVQGALRSRARVLVAAIVTMAAFATLPVASASAAEATPILTGQSNVVDLTYDVSGNLYLSDYTGQVQVLPRQSGTLFGQPVTAGTLATLATLQNVPGVAFRAGDLYMTDSDAGTISVLAGRSGTVFGQPVTADTVTTIASGIGSPLGLAFDSRGNLYVATATGVAVLPARSDTLFGQAVTRNTLTELSATSGLAAGNPGPTFLAFDRSGNLYVSDRAGGTVSVLPAATGTVFGQPVSAGTLSTVLSGLYLPSGITLDPSGNLFVSIPGNIEVLPAATGTVYGQAVSADTLTAIVFGVYGLGMTYHAGDTFLADQVQSSIDQISTPAAHITAVKFGGTPANPTITITGYGFDTTPPTEPAGCDATGLDYPYGNLYVNDVTTQVQMGVPGDCVGLVTSTMTRTKIVLTLGSFYGASTATIAEGDSVTVDVGGRAFTTTASYPGP